MYLLCYLQSVLKSIVYAVHQSIACLELKQGQWPQTLFKTA
jgi:hypothetical protein